MEFEIGSLSSTVTNALKTDPASLFVTGSKVAKSTLGPVVPFLELMGKVEDEKRLNKLREGSKGATVFGAGSLFFPVGLGIFNSQMKQRVEALTQLYDTEQALLQDDMISEDGREFAKKLVDDFLDIEKETGAIEGALGQLQFLQAQADYDRAKSRLNVAEGRPEHEGLGEVTVEGGDPLPVGILEPAPLQRLVAHYNARAELLEGTRTWASEYDVGMLVEKHEQEKAAAEAQALLDDAGSHDLELAGDGFDQLLKNLSVNDQRMITDFFFQLADAVGIAGKKEEPLTWVDREVHSSPEAGHEL